MAPIPAMRATIRGMMSAHALIQGGFASIHSTLHRATGEFRHIWGASDMASKKTDSFPGVRKMRLLIAALMATAVFLSPLAASAESADVEAVITNVDTTNLSLSLDDGKKYQAPEEFNFEGLEPGVKVLVFYTEVDGKRVINDLEVLQ
jgi:hypothetical protein